MPNILLRPLAAIAEREADKFIAKTHKTLATQENYLFKLLKLHKDTELGREYGLGSIKTIDRFRQQVPVRSYHFYEPYLERIARGDRNILNPDPVVYFNTTSGSTGKQKMIPVTERYQKSLSKANLASIGFLSKALRSRQRRFGKFVATNSTYISGQTSGGIDYGTAGTGVLRMGKFLFSQIFANPYEALKADDCLARHYLCLLFALRDPSMRGIGANFPMLLLRTCNYLERYAEDLMRDLEAGTIADWLALESDLRAQLERQCRPAAKRAAELQQIASSAGRLTPKLAWPDLAFFATARGGTSDFYFERFPDYFGDTPGFGAVFAAAEGTYSIYPELNQDGSILAIEAGFFEFIPQTEWESEHPETVLPTEVKIGDYYRILVTNYSGFYRYDNGDAIEVVGFYGTAPLLVFRHRRGGLLSSTTEKTTEFHATQTMQALQQEFSLLLEDFCITLSEDEFPAHYLVNIELAPGAELSDPQAFLDRFDRKLKEINLYYGSKRKDQVPPPRLRILSPGSFAIVRQRQVERGIPDSQLKFPHISEDRNFLAGLTVEAEIRLP
ncbi:GH3 auxin-responsive promoter family protein [Synechococcus sp. PCC 7336]|uniref:GH3 auxin-responsive promoter family protein n=1 Tax=Synechococcus sp. PCC 7336 TaxID=195250 RepID=UPI0003493E2F|nr:GH3 auxin-responsive promoter family protein [Synechococcus sp. PCC 7336]